MTDLVIPDEEIIRMTELARAHVAQGEPATASLYYEAIFLASKKLENAVQRVAGGEACMFKAERARADGMIGTAVDWYRQAVIFDPLNVEFRVDYVLRGLLPIGSLRNALTEAEAAVKIDQHSVPAWMALHEACKASGNEKGAETALMAAETLRPVEAPAES